MWLPVGAALVLPFRPTLHPEAVEIAVFAVAVWGAYVIRTRTRRASILQLCPPLPG